MESLYCDRLGLDRSSKHPIGADRTREFDQVLVVDRCRAALGERRQRPLREESETGVVPARRDRFTFLGRDLFEHRDVSRANLTESTTVNQLLLRIKELARLNQTEG